VAKQSVVWSVLISIPLVAAGLLLVRPVMDVFGMEPAVTEIGVAYLQVTMGTVVVLTLLILGGGVLRGAGDSRTPMQITARINVINIGLTYALIFGHWGFPALGVVGSAWATFLSRALGCVWCLPFSGVDETVFPFKAEPIGCLTGVRAAISCASAFPQPWSSC
jgi:MATE family multidrug resistance protein